MKDNKNTLKRVTDKVNKIIKSRRNSKKKRCESKVSARIEHDGINYEDELKTINR